MLIENQLKKLGFGTAAIFLLIVAMLLGAPQMYLMAVILALVPVAGWILNRVLLQGLVCERHAPDTADEYGRALVTVTVENRGRLPKFYLRAMDTLPRFVRYAGTPPDESVFITRLWSGESGKVKFYIEPQKRGLHRIGPLSIEATDIFGFSDLFKSVESYAEILVYPEILPVTPNLLSSGAATGWRDEQDARSRGNGTDFTGVRDYRSGDELRRINWKTTARTGTLAVTEYTQGYASDIMIVLDREASAYADTGVGKLSAFEYGVKIATALGATAMRQGSKVQLCMAAREQDEIVELQGSFEIGVLLDRLARVEADGDVPLSSQLYRGATAVGAGSIVVVITPRAPDDADLRAALDSWLRPPISANLHLFWLLGGSFADAQAQARAGAFVSARDYAASIGGGQRTAIGHEYGVGADTNLIALLGGPSLG